MKEATATVIALLIGAIVLMSAAERMEPLLRPQSDEYRPSKNGDGDIIAATRN